MAGAIAGSLIFDTKTDTSGFEKGTKEINNQAETLANSFNNVGKAIIATFSVAAIKEFGTQLIETTADLQALDAQFKQIFKGAEGTEAMKLINEQSDDLGIHVDRLKESFNKFGAQVKGSGMDSAKALEATKIATANAADAAAFYDTSLENATASVASFMKGNFEAGDAIGVYTSAAQMSIRSNEMYGKTWDKLNESERQWLLLDTITKANELSGAQGQSKRETDNWANSTGNLQATWSKFLETIGDNALRAAVTIVQDITAALNALTKMMEKGSPAIENFKLAIEGLTFALTTYFIAANRLIILDKLAAVTDRLGGAMKALGTAMMSPAAQMAFAAGAITVLIGLALRLQDSWGSMTDMQKVASAIGLVTAAAFAGAMAVGMFQTALSRGVAAAFIIGGIAALGIAITAAENKVKAASSSIPSGGSYRMPRLATGAVIPPNGEFAAILGDQKYGRNLEAPEGLIRQIMREELGKGGGGNNDIVVNLTAELDGEAIYNNQHRISRRRGSRLINGIT